MTNSASSGIRIASCRTDGRCPECGLMQAGAPWPMLDYCACRICPPCLHLHLRDLLTEALRQLDFVLRQREQLREERDAAIEAQKRHLNEATEAVHDLGDKLDCALRAVEMWKAKAIRVSGEADALKQRASLLGEAVGLATTAVPDMEINPDDPVGMMRRVVETGEKAIRERDEALDDVKTLRLIVDSQSEQVTSNAKDLYAAVRAEVATKERAERAEALLREVAAIPLVVITLGSVLLAKIREALEAK